MDQETIQFSPQTEKIWQIVKNLGEAMENWKRAGREMRNASTALEVAQSRYEASRKAVVDIATKFEEAMSPFEVSNK